MLHLRPSIRQGLLFAGVHQALVLCAVASLWVSQSLSIFLGTFLWLLDIPAFIVTEILRDYELVDWRVAWPANAPTRPAAALRYHAGTITMFAVAGATQWLLIGFARVEDAAWRARKAQVLAERTPEP